MYISRNCIAKNIEISTLIGFMNSTVLFNKFKFTFYNRNMIELKKKKKLPKRIRNVDISAGSGLFLISRKGYYVSFSCLHYEQQEVVRILKGKTIRRDRTKVFIQNIHHFILRRLKEFTNSTFSFKESQYYKTILPFLPVFSFA